MKFLSAFVATERVRFFGEMLGFRRLKVGRNRSGIRAEPFKDLQHPELDEVERGGRGRRSCFLKCGVGRSCEGVGRLDWPFLVGG